MYSGIFTRPLFEEIDVLAARRVFQNRWLCRRLGVGEIVGGDGLSPWHQEVAGTLFHYMP